MPYISPSKTTGTRKGGYISPRGLTADEISNRTTPQPIISPEKSITDIGHFNRPGGFLDNLSKITPEDATRINKERDTRKLSELQAQGATLTQAEPDPVEEARQSTREQTPAVLTGFGPGSRETRFEPDGVVKDIMEKGFAGFLTEGFNKYTNPTRAEEGERAILRYDKLVKEGVDPKRAQVIAAADVKKEKSDITKEEKDHLKWINRGERIFAALDNPVTGIISGTVGQVRRFPAAVYRQLSKSRAFNEVASILKKADPKLADSPQFDTLVSTISKETSPSQIEKLVENSKKLDAEATKKSGVKKNDPLNPPVAAADEVVVYFQKTGGNTQFVATNLDEALKFVDDIADVEVATIKKSDFTPSKVPEKAKAGIGTITPKVADDIVSTNRLDTSTLKLTDTPSGVLNSQLNDIYKSAQQVLTKGDEVVSLPPSSTIEEVLIKFEDVLAKLDAEKALETTEQITETLKKNGFTGGFDLEEVAKVAKVADDAPVKTAPLRQQDLVLGTDGLPTDRVVKNKKAPLRAPARKDIAKGAPTEADEEAIRTALTRYEKAARKPTTPDSEFAALVKKSDSVDGAKKLFGELLTPISSRLGRIEPSLKKVLRRFEFETLRNTHEGSVTVKNLVDKTKKMSMKEKAVLDLAQKNGDSQTIEALAKKHGFLDELNAVRKTLDDIYNRAQEVGIDVAYRDDYFPRMVKNPSSFKAYLRNQPEWSSIREGIEKHARDKGIKYSDLTEEEIAGIVNSQLRGYGNKVQLSQPGFKMPRTIEVIDEKLNEFYESSDSALSTYIIRMNDEIEGRKFFGKQLDVDGKAVNVQDSIGGYVMKLVDEGKLDDAKATEVSDILKARFSRSKMNGLVDAYRNTEYISTMGNPGSALTQIGDIAWSLFDNGFYHTAVGAKKILSKNGIKKEDVFIEQITQEFLQQTKTGKALQFTFKAVGLEQVDRLGKEIFLNAEMSKFKSMAKKNPDRLMYEMRKHFDEDEAKLAFQEFAEGSITDSTKLVLFNKLLDFQPVAKSEMPQKYLEMNNGRIFYMLKSFTLKQIDVFRREAIDHIVSGDPKRVKEGIRNLVRLSSMFVLANITADELKDILFNRETSLKDRTVDNLFRLIGLTKFDVYKARQEGMGQTAIKKILFPTSLWDAFSKDITNLVTQKTYEKGPLKGERYKAELPQRVPGVGKIYYWWLGRGAQKQEYTPSGSTKKSGGGNNKFTF